MKVLFHQTKNGQYRAPKEMESDLESYKAYVRQAYGNLRGVKFFFLER